MPKPTTAECQPADAPAANSRSSSPTAALSEAFETQASLLTCPSGVHNAAASVPSPSGGSNKRRAREEADGGRERAQRLSVAKADAERLSQEEANIMVIKRHWHTMLGEELTDDQAQRIASRGTTVEHFIEAKTSIVMWWRHMRVSGALTRKVIAAFLAQDLTLKRASEISFDDLAALLREERILSAATKAVQRIFYIAYGRRNTKRIAEANLNIRVFLAAYMIRFRKSFVFEHVGVVERALVTASSPILDVFHAACAAITAADGIVTPATVPTRTFGITSEEDGKFLDFPVLLNDYVTKFKTWKIPDEHKLSERIKHALQALYKAEEQQRETGESGESNEKLLAEFQAQQERLRFKLLQVAGEDVLRAFDARTDRAHLPLPTALPAPAPASGGTGGAAAGSAAAPSTSGNMYSSLPGRMSNEQLAHELLLDPDFKLDDNGGSAVENPIFARIRDTFHTAFWQSLVDDLKLQPPCFHRVIRVITEIRDGIAELGSGTKQADKISAIINPDAIQETVDKNEMTWPGCQELVNGIYQVLTEMQAKGRDSQNDTAWTEIRTLMVAANTDAAQQPKAFCAALEEVLRIVNCIRIDAANTRLRMIAPVIKIHGVEYERAHLLKKLKENQITLDRTEAWLTGAVAEETGKGRVQLSELQAGRENTYKTLHANAVVSRIACGQPISPGTLPETLQLDLRRFECARQEFAWQQFGATVLALLNNACIQTAFKDKIARAILTRFGLTRELVNGDNEADFAKAILVFGEQRTELPARDRDVLKKVLVSAVDPTNAVYKLYHGVDGRVAKAWRNIVAPLDPQRLPSPVNLPPHVMQRIEVAAAKVTALTALNMQVHAQTYNRIVGEAVGAAVRARL